MKAHLKVLHRTALNGTPIFSVESTFPGIELNRKKIGPSFLFRKKKFGVGKSRLRWKRELISIFSFICFEEQIDKKLVVAELKQKQKGETLALE